MRIACLPLLLLSSVPLWAQSPASPCPKPSHDAAADAALSQHQWESARNLYAADLAKSPSDPIALLGLTRSDLALGADAAAMDRAERELAHDAAGATGVTMRALVLYWRGDLAEASQGFLQAVKSSPCDAPAHLGLSLVLAAKGFGEAAFAEFRTAHQVDAADPAAHDAWIKRFGDPASTATADALKLQLKKYTDAEQDDAYLRQASVNTIKPADAAPASDACLATAPVPSLDQPLLAIRSGSDIAAKSGITVLIEGQPLRLLLDTTANGLVLNEAAAIRLKLQPEFELADGRVIVEGKVPSVVSSVKTIAIGGASFSGCGIRIVRNTRITDYDGYIGTATFADGLVQLLYQSAHFHIVALPGAKDGLALTRLYTLGLGHHWSSAKPVTQADTEFRRTWQGFYLIDGLIALPGKSDLWKEGLYVLATGETQSWILSHKPSTRFPAALSDHLRVGFRNDFGLESIHSYFQRTKTDTEYADDALTSIAAMGLASSTYASRKLDTAYLANQTGVSLKGILGALWVVRLDMSIDYRDRVLRLQDDKGAGFGALTGGARYFGGLTEDTHVNRDLEPLSDDLQVGLEPKD